MSEHIPWVMERKRKLEEERRKNEEDRERNEEDRVTNARSEILCTLKKNKAFNQQSAIDPDEFNINWPDVLDEMKRDGQIEMTLDNKIYLTEKGQQETKNSHFFFSFPVIIYIH